MAIERDHNGEITFECDGDNCRVVYETDTGAFERAVALLKAEKWKIKKDTDGEWYHLCRTCKD